MSRHGWRPHIESALCLDLALLFSGGALRSGTNTTGRWTWTRGGECVASVGYSAALYEAWGTLTLDYSSLNRRGEPQDETCTIPLSSRPLPFGQRYWYMHCPCSGRRARKLYKFHGLPQFCHRTAVRPLPTYASQRVSGGHRIIEQRRLIWRKLGYEGGDLLFEPTKPKWMRWRTFERYGRRDAELAGRAEAHLLAMMGDGK
jgi:hypothetical protein